MLFQFDHKSLYQQLLSLVQEHHPVFDFKDYIVDSVKVRVFNYNLTPYAMFKLPAALECRGISFIINEQDQFVKLISVPMQKFFNYKENPFTQGIEKDKILFAMDKRDGSLMSSYKLDAVRLKSKGAFFSEQAVLANEVLYSEKYAKLLDFVTKQENLDRTVNIEYTAPSNQIVLFYKEAELKVLNVRCRLTGEYIDLSTLNCPQEFIVDFKTEYHGMTMEEMFDKIQGLEDIEGFVVVTENGLWVKFKTDWYCQRHNSVDVFSPTGKKGRKALITCVLDEQSDDVKQLLNGNQRMLDILDDVSNFVADYLEKTQVVVSDFVQQNQDLSRKDYALKALALKDTFDNVALDCILKRVGDLDTIRNAIVKSVNSSNFNLYNEYMKKYSQQQSEE